MANEDQRRAGMAFSMHLADIRATHCKLVPDDESVVKCAKTFADFLAQNEQAGQVRAIHD